MVKTIFLTNNEDQNSAACEMPTFCDKDKDREGLLPVRELSILKADGRGSRDPCHADIVRRPLRAAEDLEDKINLPIDQSKQDSEESE